MAAEVDDGELIECVQKFPSVYDKNHGDYRNKYSKMNAWISIAQTIGVSEDLCEQRWVVLRNRYATELRNRKKNLPSTSPNYSWRYFEAMSFLEEYISPRRTRSRLSTTPTKRTISQEFTSESKVIQNVLSTTHTPSAAFVKVELESPGSISPNTTRLRPIAPRPAVSTVARLVAISSDSPVINNNVQSNQSCISYQDRYSECKEKTENEDEDILFGKSIGLTLRTIRNKRIKLQVKSEILGILAQHAE